MNINPPIGSSIRLIEAYVQFQSKKKTQIITFRGRKPMVSRNGNRYYENRLIPYLSNSKFTLAITDAKYNDSGNYSLYVISEQPLKEADGSVTVDITVCLCVCVCVCECVCVYVCVCYSQ